MSAPVQYQPRGERRLVARLLQTWNVCFARVYHRLEVRSPCHLPDKGPAILVCNHTSGLDPLLIQSLTPRLIVWMMAREYYEVPGLKWVFRAVDAIPVDRSGRDSAATRAALRALDAGRVLGIFPEGRIAPPGQLLPFQTGVAMMALKKSVPIYPACLDGTQRGKSMLEATLVPQSATIAFGPPLRLDATPGAGDRLELGTARIRQAVADLCPPAR